MLKKNSDTDEEDPETEDDEPEEEKPKQVMQNFKPICVSL
jgi:hypothetical protein